MKKGIIVIVYSIAFIATIAWVIHRNQTLQGYQGPNINKAPAMENEPKSIQVFAEDIIYEAEMALPERPSITFIMNLEDSESYQEAESYYQDHPLTDNEEFVNHCGSIISVIDHLRKTPRQQPWGTIRIVQRSEDWKGIHILSEEQRNTSQEILIAMASQQLNPLENGIVDANTEILVEGMGIGNNEELMKLLAVAFGGNDDERPSVTSSKLMDTYHFDSVGSYKYITESFFSFFKVEDALVENKIIQQFKTNYPHEEMDWKTTLDRLEPRFPGDSYTRYQYDGDLTTVSIHRALTIQNDEAPYTPLPFEPDMEDNRFFTTISTTPKNDILSWNE